MAVPVAVPGKSGPGKGALFTACEPIEIVLVLQLMLAKNAAPVEGPGVATPDSKSAEPMQESKVEQSLLGAGILVVSVVVLRKLKPRQGVSVIGTEWMETAVALALTTALTAGIGLIVVRLLA